MTARDYMLEHLAHTAVLVAPVGSSENPSVVGFVIPPDNQQERPFILNGILRGHMSRPVLETGEDMVRSSERSEEVGGTETTHPVVLSDRNNEASLTDYKLGTCSNSA
jgi:hypothetical protein